MSMDVVEQYMRDTAMKLAKSIDNVIFQSIKNEEVIMGNRKPFNLERALAGDPVVTMDGHKAKHVFTASPQRNEMDHLFVIFGDCTFSYWYNKDGECINDYRCNLFMAPKTTKYKIDIYQNEYGYPYIRHFYEAGQIPICDVNGNVTDTTDRFLKTISFDIDEEPKKEKKNLWIAVQKKPYTPSAFEKERYMATNTYATKEDLLKYCSEIYLRDCEIIPIEVEV